MTAPVANTELVDNFNTWRLRTNLLATTVSNNTITIRKSGRGGLTIGSGHVQGNLTASQVSTNTITGGWYSTAAGEVIEGNIKITSNTTIGGDNLGEPRSLTINANTTFNGNVVVATSGDSVFIQGDVSRIRISGGNPGDFLRKDGTLGNINFEAMTLRQVKDLSSNSAHLILSGANTSFSPNGDSAKLIFGSDLDRINMFLQKATGLGESDLYLQLADDGGQSKFVVTDNANTTVATIDSDGNVDFTGTLNVDGETTLNGNITLGDASTDTIYTKGNFANASFDGAVVHNGDTTFKGDATFDGTMYINGQVNVGDAASDIMNVSSRSDLFGDTNIGNANTDTLTVVSEIDSGITPSSNKTQLLGKTTKKWKKAFVGRVESESLNNTGKITTTTLHANGNVDFDAKLDVAGKTTLEVLHANGAVDFDSSLNVDGNTTLNGEVTLGNQTTDKITLTGKVVGGFTANGASITVGDDRTAVAEATRHTMYGNGGITTFNVYANTVFHDNVTLAGDEIAISGTASLTSLEVTGASNMKGNVDLGDAAADTISINGSVDTNIIPTGSRNLGSSSSKWNDLYVGGNAVIDGSLSNSGTTLFSAAGVLNASSTIADDAITNAMLANPSVTLTADSGTDQTLSLGQTFDIEGGEGIDTVVGATNKITISGENASTTNKGIASFDSDDFSVSSGSVSLKNATTGAVLAINGTSNEVNVSRTNGTVTVGLPDDVSITGQLNVGENVIISGNLTVSGTTTTVNTETIELADNIIVLNSNASGEPTQNAGFSVRRGNQTDRALLWNESSDRWNFTNDGTTYYNIPVPSEYDNYSSWTMRDGDGTQYTVTSADILQIASGTAITSNFTGDDVLTISHNDTSSLSGAYGSAGVSSITVDGMGHVTAISTATYDNYVSWNAKDHDGTTYPITSGDTLWFKEGSGIDVNFTADDTLTITNTDRGSSQNIFKTFTVTDTDSGYTWAETGNVVADTNSDTVTFVSGNKIDIDVSAASDAIRIAHTDTSTLNGAYGGSGISGITVDNAGHVTAISTATYDNYVKWIARADSGTDDNITSGEVVDFIGGTAINTSIADAGVTINHADTSSVSNLSVDGSGSSALQDISFTFDSMGHVTGATASSANFLRADEADHKTSGTLYIDDNITLAFGTGADIEFWWSSGDFYTDINAGANWYLRDGNNSNTTRFKFDIDTGDLTLSTGALIESSDQRLKTDIQPITNAVDKVMALGGYTYNKEDNNTRRTGVIAQEVLEVLPEAVSQSEETGYYNVAYGNMVGLLIEAIKEQQKEIEELKKKLV